tara:strand:- start:396 stop:530 length:135 start_codon:yes stop_codon:yes gene_type:complete
MHGELSNHLSLAEMEICGDTQQEGEEEGHGRIGKEDGEWPHFKE